MFRIIEVDHEPIDWVPVVNVAPGGRLIERRQLPVHVARADGLPSDLAGLVATSDLQAYDSVERPPFARRLAGLVVAEVLDELAERGAIPPLDELGAILPGDYYAVPTLDRRGGLGDVRPVWEAFQARFAFTVGVAGNHDAFGAKTEPRGAIPDAWNARLLDGKQFSHGELTLGGVSGILGKKSRPWRHSKKKLRKKLRKASKDADILVLHEGPNIPGTKLRGSWDVRAALLKEVEHPTTIFCGHRNWPRPIEKLGPHTVVNVDSRVLVIVSAS
jgi:hypothetical protein